MADSCDTTYRSALNRALGFLARRDHSAGELIQKLTGRGYAEEIVQQVIAECSRLNYLDDGRAALQVIDRMKRRGMGVRRIRSELQRRLLEGEQTEAHLRARMTPAEERSTARRVALKKWRALSGDPDAQKKKRRLQQFLRYRGFSESLIFEMLKEMQA